MTGTVADEGKREGAFRALVVPLIGELHAHCYRMLASAEDAEDVLQEALLRAWRGLGGFAGRSSPRVWLYRIATNACLDALTRRRARVLDAGDPPARDAAADREGPAWVEPFADRVVGLPDGRATPEARYEQRESVELAFVAALQHLSPNQRAVLILREVLGFSAREVADVLGATSTAVNSALQHARRRLEERLPERSQQTTLRELGDEVDELALRYATALEQGDVEAMVAMLTADATWSMPPTPRRYTGLDAIVGFLVAEPFTLRWRHIATRANGQLAFGWYRHVPAEHRYRAEVLEVLTLRGPRIAAVTAFIGGERFARFDLPAALPSPGDSACNTSGP